MRARLATIIDITTGGNSATSTPFARSAMVTRETMTVANDLSSGRDVYYDPSDVDITANPYPIYACLREETPIYHNASYGFWALSRHADVEKALSNWETFSNSAATFSNS